MRSRAASENSTDRDRHTPRMSTPVIVAIESDAEARRDIDATLHVRYGRDYRLECARSPHEALTRMEQLANANANGDVALVLRPVARRDDGDRPPRPRAPVPPQAERGLLVDWGHWGVPAIGSAIYEVISNDRIDHYLLRPSPPPDEFFHHAISGWLLEWAESQRVSPFTINIVGESWSGRAYELRELLGSCAMPHTFSLADSDDGRVFVDQAGGAGGAATGDLPGRDDPARSHQRPDRRSRGFAGQPGSRRRGIVTVLAAVTADRRGWV